MKISIVPLFITGIFFLSNCGQKSPNTSNNSSPVEEKSMPDLSDWTVNKGIGPVTTVTFSKDIEEDMASNGQNIFTAKCSACHKPAKRYIGPALVGIFDRRTPEWVMNMILNPMQMVQEDPIAKELLMEYNGTPMANQNLTQEEARDVLEYFRTLKSE